MRVRTLAGISIFWVGLSVLGDAFVTLVLAQRLSEVAAPAALATTLGLVTSAGILAGMVVQPLAGALSDRLRPVRGRRVQVLVGAAAALAGLLVFAGAETIVAIAVAFVLIQVAASVAQAAQQGFIPDLVDSRWRGRAAGLKGFADLGGAFVGFGLIAVLIGPDLGPALLGVGAAVAVSAILTAVLVRERPAPAAGPPAAGPPAAGFPGGPPGAGPPRPSGVPSLDASAFALVVAARFTFLLGTFAIGRYFLLYVADRLGVAPAEASADAAGILAVLTLATAIASIPSGWLADRLPRRRVMVAGALVSAIGAGLLLVASSSVEIMAYGVIMSLGTAAFVTANWALTTDLVPRSDAARLMGIANIGTAGAAAAAGVFGFVIDMTRPGLVGLPFGGLFAVAAALFVVSAALSAALRPPAQVSGDTATMAPEASEP